MLHSEALGNKQLAAIDGRALSAFGSKTNGRLICYGLVELGSNPYRFKDIKTGTVLAITFRYTDPYFLTADDLVVSGGLGYERENTCVSIARVDSNTEVEIAVKLERAVCMSFGNGPTVASDSYVLHKDGTVKYFDPDSGMAVSWAHHIPRWEQTRFPVVPAVVSGI